jgi:cytochrome c-type biogenesis protein CcsB
MKKILFKIFSMPLASILTLTIAIAIGTATFIENDFGTATAQKIIYKASWFELVIFLFAITLCVNMVRFNLFRLKKIPILIFHLAGILVILGAGITRYISYEGLMPIREGSSTNQILSIDTYMNGTISKGDMVKKIDDKVLFASLGNNSFNKTIDMDGQQVKIHLKDFFPDSAEKIEEAEDGYELINLIFGSRSGRQNIFVKTDEIVPIDNLLFGFNSDSEADVKIFSRNDSLFCISKHNTETLSMLTQQMDTLAAGETFAFQMQHLYTFNQRTSIVLSNYFTKGKIVPFAKSKKVVSSAYNALVVDVEVGDTKKEIVLYGNSGVLGKPEKLTFGDITIDLSYGSKNIDLPFEIKLKDFEMERYAGSNSASSYASEVTLLDPADNVNMDYRIYMNHVLNYKGYRFFQSSYDPDELGTVLSVNHDFWGSTITYLAYLMLAIGMSLTFFSKNTRIRKLSNRITKFRNLRTQSAIIALLLLSSFGITAQQSTSTDLNVIPKEHAAKFGDILVQDMMGRIKPVNTLSSELIRKLTGRDVYEGQNSDQVLLGMIAYPQEWGKKKLIKVSHPQLKEILGVEKYASYEDFFNADGYVLSKYADESNRITSANRSKFDKDVIKVDERLNILYMIFRGSFLKIFPKENDPGNKWFTPAESASIDFGEEANLLVHNFLSWYLGNLDKAIQSNDWKDADFGLEGLSTYQAKYGAEIMPSQAKLNTEIMYNKMDVFGKLISWYGLVGFVLLMLLMVQIFKPEWKFKWPVRIGIGLIVIGFLFHTIGLAMRWYISGHAPWSNGYESVIYIAWATVLAGLLFSRKSAITLGATSILAAWILIVSMMSWADPQITNLVPVLKSYWLTIHVSIITSSYGFLAIGAILAFMNLLLIILRKNKDAGSRLSLTINELSSVIESSLIIGLFLLTIGTFLGGVWANESWGRYWGWDAKETWSMVSILVYTFIVHTRFIPGLKTVYAFNLLSFVGFASIIMTYFGVNFYLSGLHSYATGDPVPIPAFVYYALMVTIIVATIAYFRQNPNEKIT